MTYLHVWHGALICVTWLRCCIAHGTTFYIVCVLQFFSCVCHNAFIRVAWHIHMCVMTHSFMWHDSFVCVTWLICICDITRVLHRARANTTLPYLICVTWLTLMCDMTHPYVWHDLSIRVTWFTLCVTWLTHMCDMTHPYVWHDSPICVTWLAHMCDVITYVWHDLLICVTWLKHMCTITYFPYERVMSHTWMSHGTHVNEYLSYILHLRDMPHPYYWHMTWLWSCITREQALPSFVLYVCYDLFVCVIWLMCTCDMTHPCVWHDSSICVTWLIHMCDMTHPYVWHDSSICVTWLRCCITREYAVLYFMCVV